jgi:hypothetical protein
MCNRRFLFDGDRLLAGIFWPERFGNASRLVCQGLRTEVFLRRGDVLMLGLARCNFAGFLILF